MFSTELAEIVLIVEDVERSARIYREAVALAPEDARSMKAAPGPISPAPTATSMRSPHSRDHELEETIPEGRDFDHHDDRRLGNHRHLL
jgi:hypothetical protein